MVLWIKKKAAWDKNKTLLLFPFLLSLFAVCSNDTTIGLETHSYIMSSLSHVTIRWYFIHYRAYYEAAAAAARAGAYEDTSNQDKQSSYRICSLINLRAQPHAHSDIKWQFGESFSLSLLAHNQHRSSFCNIKLPMAEISSLIPSLPSLKFLPLSWVYRQQSGRGNFCSCSREITSCC